MTHKEQGTETGPGTSNPIGAKVIDLYCRISEDYDGTLRSCEDQEAEGRAWCRREGHQVGIVRYDHALSAWKSSVVRPSFIEIMDRVEARESDGVWIRNLDRFTRKMEEAMRIKRAIEAGALVASTYSTYDVSTANGLQAFYNEAVNAEVESKRISERTTRGMMNKVVVRGKANVGKRGFGRPGYVQHPGGWRAAKGTVREAIPAEQVAAEQAAIRDAAARLIAGSATFTALADEWNEQGLLTTSGNQWTGLTVRQMLESPALAGLIQYKGVTHAEEENPILDKATWNRLMLNFAGRKRGRSPSTYLLSGLVRCQCGGLLYGRPKGATPYQDGSPRRQYWCAVKPKALKGGGCGRVSTDQRHADAEVRGLVTKALADPNHRAALSRAAMVTDTARAEVLGEVKRLNDEVDALLDKQPDAVWTLARIDKKANQYRDLLEEQQAKLDALGEAPEHEDPIVDANAEWDEADLAGRRALVKRAFPQGLTILPAGTGSNEQRKANRIVPTNAAGRYTKAS